MESRSERSGDREPSPDLCRVCVLVLLGLEGAQMGGLL